MTQASDELDPHRKYLAHVSRDVVRRRLEVFRLDENIMEVLPFVCMGDRISEKFAKWKRWLHPLDPISLDDLKNWFGVPNEVARQQLSAVRTLSADGKLWGRWTRVSMHNLPMQPEFEFERLEPEQKVSVRQMAFNLLHGYVDPAEVERAPIAGVVRYMIEQTRKVKPKVFAVPDMIVCPDETVDFEDIAVLLANNILIYGNGQIRTRSHMKIHAVQIRHVA